MDRPVVMLQLEQTRRRHDIPIDDERHVVATEPVALVGERVLVGDGIGADPSIGRVGDDLVPYDDLIERLREGAPKQGLSVSWCAKGAQEVQRRSGGGAGPPFDGPGQGCQARTLGSVSYSAVTYTKSCFTFQLKTERRSQSMESDRMAWSWPAP